MSRPLSNKLLNWLNVAASQVQKGLAENALRLLDARAANRFRGDIEPLDTVAGHIPGAVNVPFQDNIDALGKFLAPEILRTQYLETISGFSPAATVAMCGSGVTACHNILAAVHAGMEIFAVSLLCNGLY